MTNFDSSMSVLLADVSGSVRLHEKLGGTEALQAIDRCQKRMVRAVEGFGGRIVKIVGDELMAVFSVTDEAFQAAIEMQQRVASLPPVSGVKLAIRVGLAHGLISEKEGSVVGKTVDAAAHLAGMAKPGQVLTSVQAHAELSLAWKKTTRKIESLAATGTLADLKVFEFVSPDEATLLDKDADTTHLHTDDSSPGACLRLRYAGKVVILCDKKKRIKMGRDAKSDIVIHDCRASRNHAMIERRGDTIVLIDTSTNGTFVTLSGERELSLRNAECVIHGNGLICFAASATSSNADCAEFESI